MKRIFDMLFSLVALIIFFVPVTIILLIILIQLGGKTNQALPVLRKYLVDNTEKPPGFGIKSMFNQTI